MENVLDVSLERYHKMAQEIVVLLILGIFEDEGEEEKALEEALDRVAVKYNLLPREREIVKTIFNDIYYCE